MLLPRLILCVSFLALGACASGCATTSTAGDKEFKKGLAQADEGNVKAAMKTLQAGAKAYPHHLRMRFALARLQYESGEAHHIKEREYRRAVSVYIERRRRKDARNSRRKADALRAKATPFYLAARKNLRFVIANGEGDQRLAWAYQLLSRVDVFFEDWEKAYEDLDRAIDLGKPTGSQLARWKEFQAGIKEKMRSSLHR